MSVATFKLRVACDLYGSKHNAMFLFKPPPVALSEVIQEAQRFYTEEAEKRRPAGHVGPSFQVSSLQVYNAATTQWEDVYDLSQLIDGCQLYAFQHQALMTQPNEPTPVHAPAEVPQQQPAPPQQPAALNWSQPATCDGTRTGIAFAVLDTKRDGVITLDEMTEAFRALHLRFTPNQVQDLFVVADEDRDNVVSRDEFDRFAVRFPTVIDSIHQKRFDDEVMAREEAVLAEAEKALEAEQEAESRLMHESQAASKRVRDLMAQIADHRLSHEVQLQRKPVVDAQQQQLIEQELALAAQKERLKQAQEDLRRDIEDQLAQVSQNLGIAVPAGEQQAAARGNEPAAAAAQQQQQQGGAVGDARLGSVSENSSSFFLPSERTDAEPRAQADVHREESPPPPAALRLAVGAEVEACNFETKPEFNGLRGKVTALKDDGKVAVEFCIRGGLNLDMLPSNIRPVVPATNPALWQEVEAAGPANSVGGIVDLRGEKGRVVGFRGETLLCEFAPRPGIFELPTHSLVQQQQQQQQAQAQNPFSLQEAVAREVAQAAQDAGRQQPPVQQPSAQQDLAAELEQARRETAQLKAELAAERTRRGEANVRSPLARTAPDSAAALTRLAGMSQSPTAGAVPGVYPASPLAGFPPTAHHYVGHAGLAAETVRELGSNALLPSTQEILRRVGASIAPSDHRSPSLLPPAPASMSTTLKAYALGPIDPSTL